MPPPFLGGGIYNKANNYIRNNLINSLLYNKASHRQMQRDGDIRILSDTSCDNN